MANEFVARNGIIALNDSQITGSLHVSNGITGSLFGTSSWALSSISSSQAISSSFASTASYALSSDIPPPNIRRNAQSSNINYCGYARSGSLENQAVWTITKITVATNGSVTTTTSNNVTWTSVPF
jgi:hypothetical protein